MRGEEEVDVDLREREKKPFFLLPSFLTRKHGIFLVLWDSKRLFQVNGIKKKRRSPMGSAFAPHHD